ncbi:large exoprotein [Microbacterium sp.]|uniref:large exoprotein n=1 Tax=Microbacterium sp. TaxID=51671 RepID=UPI003A8902A2
MDGQVLGGGVIVLVAVLLWLVYLLPSWHGRLQFQAAERNAVRLNQTLRVLAETTEVPDEVRVELNARAVHEQRRVMRRIRSEQEAAQAQSSRAAVETARAQARADAARAQVEFARAREQARAEERAARAVPSLRKARVRRCARLVATVLALSGIVLAGSGAVVLAVSGAQALLWVGVAVTALSAGALVRMGSISWRAEAGTVPVVERSVPASIQDVDLSDARAWTPRQLPPPLVSSSGSRAAAALDQAAEREAVRRAAQEGVLRARAARTAPTPIERARRAHGGAPAAHDDAAIEAHVRSLLERRAAGM